MSAKTDVRVDEKIAGAPAFARPILTHLRRLVRTACPDAEETIKWGRVTFVYRGRLLCGMAAFKAHCGFGFWHPEMAALLANEQGGEKAEEGSGQFGRLADVADLPDDATMQRYLAQAMRLNESGQPVRSRPPAGARKPDAAVPSDLAALLGEHPGAGAAFERFSPSHRREYIEWITGAKRPETRRKRLATTIEWLIEGRSRNWKHEPAKAAAKGPTLAAMKKAHPLAGCAHRGKPPVGSTYFSNTFLMSPTLFWTLPLSWSSWPSSWRSGLFVAAPTFSFTLPVRSLSLPSILSLVLSSMRVGSF